MTKQQKNLWTLYRAGHHIDVLWTMARYKTRDAAMDDLKKLRFDYWRSTGEKV